MKTHTLETAAFALLVLRALATVLNWTLETILAGGLVAAALVTLAEWWAER